METYWGLSVKKTKSSSLCSHSLLLACLLGIRPCEIFPSMVVFQLVCLVQTVMLLKVRGNSTPAMSGRHCLTEVLVRWLLQSFCPSSRMFPEPQEQGLCCRCLNCSDSPISLRPKFVPLPFSPQKLISEVINLDHVPDHTVGLVGISIH